VSELAGLCTRVLVMREGRLVAEVDGEQATELELLSHAVTPPDEEAAVLAEETR
jgi:ribose transport system ATP-binding protein